jgi:hypothetical protein
MNEGEDRRGDLCERDAHAQLNSNGEAVVAAGKGSASSLGELTSFSYFIEVARFISGSQCGPI